MQAIVLDYLLSSGVVGVMGIGVLGIPLLLLYQRFFGMPRFILILALMGLYCFLAYLKPSVLPLWTLWLAVMMVVSGIWYFLKGHRESIWEPLKSWPVVAIWFYSFILFFLRWEPPGSQSTVLGSLARLIAGAGSIPGNTSPLSSVVELKGANVGLAVVAAVFHAGHWVSWERIVLFIHCLSLVLFCFALMSVLCTWFSRYASSLATLIVLVMLTVPQQHLFQGQASLLLGLTSGLCLIEFIKALRLRTLSIIDIGMFSCALAFSAFSHPGASVVSLLVCAPMAVGIMIQSGKGKSLFIPFGLLFLLALGLFSPFLLQWGGEINMHDMGMIWDEQKKLSPFLFQGDHSVLVNLGYQLIAYVSGAGILLCLSLLVLSFFMEKKSHKFFSPFFLTGVVIVLIVFNVKHWFLPASALLSPNHAGTMLVLPLAMALAWFVEQSWASGKRQIVGWSLFGLILFFSFQQSYSQLYPHLFTAQLTAQDRQAMEYMEKFVPETDCIQINDESAGKWIPVLAFRCTVPFPGFPAQVVSIQGEHYPGVAEWRYYAFDEPKPALPQKGVVFNNGAMIVRTH